MAGKKPFVTLGDAIDSFLQEPDDLTKEVSCLEYWEAECWSGHDYSGYGTVHSWNSKPRRYKIVLCQRRYGSAPGLLHSVSACWRTRDYFGPRTRTPHGKSKKQRIV